MLAVEHTNVMKQAEPLALLCVLPPVVVAAEKATRVAFAASETATCLVHQLH